MAVLCRTVAMKPPSFLEEVGHVKVEVAKSAVAMRGGTGSDGAEGDGGLALVSLVWQRKTYVEREVRDVRHRRYCVERIGKTGASASSVSVQEPKHLRRISIPADRLGHPLDPVRPHSLPSGVHLVIRRTLAPPSASIHSAKVHSSG